MVVIPEQRAGSAQWLVTGRLELGLWHALVEVPKGGYRWMSGRNGDVLVEADLAAPARVRAPLRDGTAVHRALWNLYRRYPPGLELQAAILRFTEVHGPLGLTAQPGPMGSEEPYVEWLRAIRTVGRLTTLWDLIREPAGRGSGPLGTMIVWETKESRSTITWRVSDKYGPQDELVCQVASVAHHADLHKDWQPGRDVLKVAEFAFADALNRELRDAAAPQLMPLRTRDGSGHMVGRLVTTSLIKLAFVQLYLEVSGQRHYRPCLGPRCPEWIDVSERHSHVKTCSDRCRKRLERARKAQRAQA